MKKVNGVIFQDEVVKTNFLLSFRQVCEWIFLYEEGDNSVKRICKSQYSIVYFVDPYYSGQKGGGEN